MTSNLMQNEIKKYEKLIERNPDSPLLVRLAWLYLESGNVEKAMALCNKAIKKYPDYSTAHLVMAKCYIEMGAYSKALEELNRVIEILPDSKFVIDLISKIALKQKREEPQIKEKIKEEIKPPTIKITKDIYDEVFKLPNLDELEKTATTEKSAVTTQASYLDELIKRIEIGKTEKKDKKITAELISEAPEEELTYENIELVTPALAEILEKQGAFEEAIKVYRKLIEQRPYEKEKYEQRIKELEEQINKQ